ncbi:MAG: glycosyltransferase family 2 protein [Ilumatobacter sp.]|uniref:glycosyltransferase family 2 protein n=1 Tax=Ilumatobacter sp. TaxID=1967498 RepID=UPI0032995A91
MWTPPFPVPARIRRTGARREPSSGRFVDIEVADSPNRPDLDVTGPALVIAREGGVPVGSTFVPPGTRLVGPFAEVVEMRAGAPLPAPTDVAVEITVAICTRNRPELLERCLQAIRVAVDTAGSQVVARILVVNNASDNDRPMAVAQSMGVEVVREPVPGLDVARNRAVAAATGEVLAFVDDDTVADPTWLLALARSFAAHPDAVAVTGSVTALSLATDAQVTFEGCGGFFKGWHAGPLEWDTRPGLPFDPGIGVGCNMAFRRSALASVGPFDEALDTGPPLAGGGDLDMLVRMARFGTVVYEPSAMVRHEHRATLEALGAQYRSWGLSWGAVLHKWYRRSPTERKLIRSVTYWTVRWYVHDLIVPRAPGHLRHRDAWRMLVGFAAGVTTAYPRSQRRMARRRAEAAGLAF